MGEGASNQTPPEDGVLELGVAGGLRGLDAHAALVIERAQVAVQVGGLRVGHGQRGGHQQQGEHGEGVVNDRGQSARDAAGAARPAGAPGRPPDSRGFVSRVHHGRNYPAKRSRDVELLRPGRLSFRT